MDTQQLDLFAGRKRKDAGLAMLEHRNSEWLRAMRRLAELIAVEHGRVCIDDLRSRTHPLPTHKNAWGAIFKDKCWRRIGFEPSSIPSNHARVVSVWRYEG